ncbi:DUF5999 family protein [Dactylosporangium sucinum]|uniref:Uncharacterized protein n=1 Tax=Dactylosporangium sucinum TaxID=1424081 RepID=A0A917WRF0_9ACTN|nr:DUF5999 family protein [Dactylosporangium sucinum]GGM23158.1 hypothetical protein GCM10007977_025470 [Dactylosporangium sucinum]
MPTAELAVCQSATTTCAHQPPCPPSGAVDHGAARVVASHPEQGWNLLCNGVIVFEDTGELMPDCRVVDPRRGPARMRALEEPGPTPDGGPGSDAHRPSPDCA